MKIMIIYENYDNLWSALVIYETLAIFIWDSKSNFCAVNTVCYFTLYQPILYFSQQVSVLNIKTRSNNNNNTFLRDQQISVHSSKSNDSLSVRITTSIQPFNTNELSAIKVPMSALPKNQSNVSIGSLVYGNSNLFNRSPSLTYANRKNNVKGNHCFFLYINKNVQIFNKQLNFVK